MNNYKPIITALVLAVFTAIIYPLYSFAAYELFMVMPTVPMPVFILLTVLNFILLIGFAAVPTVFAAAKFGLKPAYTLFAAFAFYVLYSAVPNLPFFVMIVHLDFLDVTSGFSKVFTSWAEVLIASAVLGGIMCSIAVITRAVLKRKAKKE